MKLPKPKLALGCGKAPVVVGNHWPGKWVGLQISLPKDQANCHLQNDLEITCSPFPNTWKFTLSNHPIFTSYLFEFWSYKRAWEQKEKRHSAGNALNKASYSNSKNTKVVVETLAPTSLREIQTSIFSNSAGLKCLQIDSRYSNLAALSECPFPPTLTNLLSSPLFHLISSILYFPTFCITKVPGAKIHSHLLVYVLGAWPIACTS